MNAWHKTNGKWHCYQKTRTHSGESLCGKYWLIGTPIGEESIGKGAYCTSCKNAERRRNRYSRLGKRSPKVVRL